MCKYILFVCVLRHSYDVYTSFCILICGLFIYKTLLYSGTLGELEEISPSPKRISCEQLYKEAIQSSRKFYRNHHVYPYTYQVWRIINIEKFKYT